MELKELLFKKCQEAFEDCERTEAEEKSYEFGKFSALYDVIETAGIENDYCIWIEENNPK